MAKNAEKCQKDKFHVFKTVTFLSSATPNEESEAYFLYLKGDFFLIWLALKTQHSGHLGD